MNGKIIIIEGSDIVDKQIYVKKLMDWLKKIGYKVYYHSFPSYNEKQAALACMLKEKSFEIEGLNYKISNCFLASDRVATYLLTIKDKIDTGHIVLIDGYTTFSMLQKAALGETRTVINKAVDWISEFEYKDLKLPKPNIEIFLSMNKDYCAEILPQLNDTIQKRYNNSIEYFNKIIRLELFVARGNKWDIIECNDKEKMKSEEEISKEIYQIVLSRI